MVAPEAFANTAADVLDEQALDRGRFRTGEVIADAFVIRSILGAGGMGHVYAADELALHRPVAIKVNRPDKSELLLTEAQALAQVHHRNVVSVHRYGVHRGVPFLAMERLYGRTLAEDIAARQGRGRPTELDTAIEMLFEIASGLDALHAASIAHLDLKPGNVIVCAGQRAVLVDLGVMVAEVTAGPRRPCGTPLYMAPELIEGELVPGRAHQADLYAFGALAHELLTGAPIFAGADPVELMHAHLVEVPVDVRELRADVPERLARLVRMCLMKDPDERPHGALEVTWELRAIRSSALRARR